VGAPFKSMT